MSQEGWEKRQERVVRGALPRFETFADDLEAVARSLFGQRITYEPDVGADVMSLSFVTKQREHLHSVRLLIAASQHRDALLIARTMIEGLSRLLWAFNKVPERTELWLWFGAILDWRRTLSIEEAGIVVNPREKAELKELVKEHGPNYYREAVRKDMEAAEKEGVVYELPDDPWRTDWTPTKVESMFVELAAKPLYDGVYRDSSEWVHWGPRAILRAMEPADWGVSGFAEEDLRAAAMALQIGCQSLLQSLEVLDRHFSLGRTDRLAALAETMEIIIAESIAAGDSDD